MKKSYYAVALAVLISCFLAATTARAQNKKQTDNKTDKKTTAAKIVKEGVGFDGIKVGKSTMAEIVKKYGKGYKWTAFKKYSYSMSYPKLGLAFYMCQADSRKQIFDIEIRSPFQAKTGKGIVLGKSTLEDIYKLYGKNKKDPDSLQYAGVSFFYTTFKGKKTVTVIDIVEKGGIRQCSESK